MARREGALTVSDRPSAEIEPPKPVRLAKAVWIGGAAIGAVRSIVQLADRRTLVEQLRTASPELTQDQLNSLASNVIALVLLILAGFLAVNVWLANRMASGRHWARVLITVLAAGELFFGVLGLVALSAGYALPAGVAFDGVQLAISIVGLIIDAVVLVLLLRPESRAYFARMRTPRPPRPVGPPPSPFL